MIPRQGAEIIAPNHRSPAPPTQGRPITPPPPHTPRYPLKIEYYRYVPTDQHI